MQDVSELVDLHISGSVIKNTNFRPAKDLVGHRRNTFKEPGGHSWACSKPVKFENYDFENGLSKFKLREDSDNANPIFTIAQRVEKVMRTGLHKQAFEALYKNYGGTELNENTPLLKAFTTMVCFREITGIQWLSVHR